MFAKQEMEEQSDGEGENEEHEEDDCGAEDAEEEEDEEHDSEMEVEPASPVVSKQVPAKQNSRAAPVEPKAKAKVAAMVLVVGRPTPKSTTSAKAPPPFAKAPASRAKRRMPPGGMRATSAGCAT